MHETSGSLHVIIRFAEFPCLEVVENVSPQELRKLIDVKQFFISSDRCSMPMICAPTRLRLPLKVELGK